MKLYIVVGHYSKDDACNIGICGTYEEAQLIKINRILEEIAYVDEGEKNRRECNRAY